MFMAPAVNLAISTSRRNTSYNGRFHQRKLTPSVTILYKNNCNTRTRFMFLAIYIAMTVIELSIFRSDSIPNHMRLEFVKSLREKLLRTYSSLARSINIAMHVLAYFIINIEHTPLCPGGAIQLNYIKIFKRHVPTIYNSNILFQCIHFALGCNIRELTCGNPYSSEL